MSDTATAAPVSFPAKYSCVPNAHLAAAAGLLPRPGNTDTAAAAALLSLLPTPEFLILAVLLLLSGFCLSVAATAADVAQLLPFPCCCCSIAAAPATTAISVCCCPSSSHAAVCSPIFKTTTAAQL
jgi:hypothetical protein